MHTYNILSVIPSHARPKNNMLQRLGDSGYMKQGGKDPLTIADTIDTSASKIYK